jgi:hypothetical protein
VEPEGPVIGPAGKVVRVDGLYDAWWSWHALDISRCVPKVTP